MVLCFGLVRPYKGIDVLLEAFREFEGVELWIVGMPRMPLDALEALAARCRATVRFVPRFITDPEIPAYFSRADLVVLLPRDRAVRRALHGARVRTPIVASDVGGFGEVAAETGALRVVPPGDAPALARALAELLADADERDALAAAAGAADGIYSWDAIAERTLDVYRTLVPG